MIVMVFGLPGSGKTYLASRLASEIGATSVSTDRVRRQVLNTKSYSSKEKSEIYELVLIEVMIQISAGNIVVVDGTFHRAKERLRFLEKLGKRTSIRFIEVKADENLIKRRLANKRIDSDADWKVYLKIKSEWEIMPEPHLELYSSEANVEPLLEKCLVYLDIPYDQRTNQ